MSNMNGNTWIGLYMYIHGIGRLFVSFSKWVPNFRGFFFGNFRAGIWVYGAIPTTGALAGIWLRGRAGSTCLMTKRDSTWFRKKHVSLFTCFWDVDDMLICWFQGFWLTLETIIYIYINQEHLAMFLNLLVCCLFFGLEFQIGSSTSDSLLITVSKGNNFHPPKYVCQTDWCSSQYVGRWIRMLRRQLPALREMWHAHQCDYLSRKFVRSQYLGHLPKMFLYLPFLQRFNHCTFDLAVLIKMANCCKVTW